MDECPHVLEYQFDGFPVMGLPCLLPAGHGGQHLYRETARRTEER